MVYNNLMFPGNVDKFLFLLNQSLTKLNSSKKETLVIFSD